jgi:putative ABC transport system ATP-binding protein
MTTQTPIAVDARGVNISFGLGESKVVALNETNFSAHTGELIMLVGPSGCGKTTLLSVIAGTLTPQSGQIEVFGKRLDGLSQEELNRLPSKKSRVCFSVI